MKISNHPLWRVGFRPFFALACLAGLSLPIVWAMIFAGRLAGPSTTFSSLQWHAHEMFFGFGWAVLGGFLLTSTKNWVHQRGYHGQALIFLVVAWLVERAAMWFAASLPPLLFLLANNLFLGAMVLMLGWTLIRYRDDDTFPDNYFFLIILPLFLVAKNLMLSSDHFEAGWTMALGLFRVAFLVMFERTLTQFMKNVFQVSILRHPLLDRSIKLLAVTLVFVSAMPPLLAAVISLALAALLLGRFVFWKPQLAMRRIELAIMYLGYLAIVAQLLLNATDSIAPIAWVGTVAVHVFTFGAMGLVIPAMLIRIAKGHTGRKVVFDSIDKAVLWIMILGFVARIVLPQFSPAAYLRWLDLAATCWLLAFAILGWRYIPYLLRERVDGKEH
ncbi:MAG: NnrS family protein [Proteobacteria bacterium]|nr:NnrS family protein [Pseudomonadota bacterium]